MIVMDFERIINSASSERGSTLVLALLVMVILSLLGITAMTSSSSDLVISRNQSIYNRNFALAEAAARIGALAVRETRYVPQQDRANLDASVFSDAEKPVWMYLASPGVDNLKSPGFWANCSAPVVEGETVYYRVRYDGTSGILDATGNQTSYPFRYTIFGRSIQGGGEVIVQMGYKLILNRAEIDAQSD